MSTELKVFDSLKTDISAFVAPLTQIKVTDRNSGNQVIEALKTVKVYLKKIEEARKAIVSPLNAKVKEVNAYASDIENPLLNVERIAKAQLVAFEEIQERTRQEEHRKAQERMREIQAKADAERVIQEAALAQKQREEGVELDAADLFGSDEGSDLEVDRKELEARQAAEKALHDARLAEEARNREMDAKIRADEIENTRLRNTKKVWKCEAVDLALVPREFLKIELNSAAVLAAARGGVTSVPGVKLWQESQIAIGAHTSLKELGGAGWDAGGSKV